MIDYDAVALAPMLESPEDFDQTRFAVDDDSILAAASRLATNLREVNVLFIYDDRKRKRTHDALWEYRNTSTQMWPTSP